MEQDAGDLKIIEMCKRQQKIIEAQNKEIQELTLKFLILQSAYVQLGEQIQTPKQENQLAKYVLESIEILRAICFCPTSDDLEDDLPL